MQKTSVNVNGKRFQIFLRDTADESVANEIFKYHEYRRAEEAIKSAKFAIVDVGAHAGFFSIYAKGINSFAKIYALEPEKNNLSALNNNISENKIAGIIVVPAALGAVSGKRKLLISPDSHNHKLMPPDAASDSEPTSIVDVYSFFDFCKNLKINKISLLKMDIEGGEYEVLKAMSKEDFDKIEYLILEYHESGGNTHQSLENIIRVNGFSVQIFPSKFDKKMGFLFARNKKFDIME